MNNLEFKIRLDSYDYSFISTDDVSRFLMKFPRIISEFENTNKLCHVIYLSNRERYTFGLDEFITLYILRGKYLVSIKTKSGYVPSDILA